MINVATEGSVKIANAQVYDDRNIIANKLNTVFLDYAEENDMTSIVKVETLSSKGCAALFGMLDPKTAKKIYGEEEISNIIQLSASLAKEVLTFIKYCLYPKTNIDLLAESGHICMETEEQLAITIAMGVDSYLTTQLKL